MDKLDDIITLPTGAFALMLVIVSFLIRRFFESIWPTLSKKTPESRAERVWEGVVLPFLPAALGALITPLMRVYPLPHVVTASIGSRVVFGLCIGWFSSSFYAVFVFVAKKKWNIDVPTVDD